MHRRPSARLVAALVATALALTGVFASATPAGASPSPLQITGPITVQGPISTIERDAGISTPLSDGNRLWAFGDSYGGGFHTSTAAFTTPAAPDTMVESFDANGERYELVPHTADEAAFNTGLRFHPTPPIRLADTRDATGAAWPGGRAAGPLRPADALWLDVDSIAALSQLVGGGAVVLNITGVNTTAESTATHLSVGQVFTTFTTSTLNLGPGETAANLTTMLLGLGGIIGVRNNSGATHVVVDLFGWYDAAHTATGAAPDGVGFAPVAPTRVLDTGHADRLTAGAPRTVTVTGGPVPAGATAAVVNLTADAPSADTHLTAWPAGQAMPTTSNLNLPAGTTRANLAVVDLDALGRFTLATNTGTTRAIVDVVGWFGPGADADLVPVSPVRLLDTRADGTPLVAGVTRTITLDPAHVPAGTTAAVVNLTAVGTTAATHLTAWAAGQAVPATSNLNLPAGATRPNLAVVPLDAQGRIAVRTNSGTTHLVIDLLGFTGRGAARPNPCPARSPAEPRPYLALWPQSVVTLPQGPGHDAVLVYFIAETVCTSVDYVHGDAGLARYDYRPGLAGPGQAPVIATRLTDHLFPVSEPYAWGRGGVVADDGVHLFGCDPTADLACRRTVAPTGADLTQRSSYVDDATDLDLPPNLAALNPPADLSVEWVPALGLYTMLYIPPPWPADTALLRTASRLDGPWSDPITLTLPGCSGGENGCYTPRVRPDRSTATSLAFTFFDKSAVVAPLFDGRLVTASVPVAVTPVVTP